MVLKSIPHIEIVKTFFRQGTSEEIAFCLRSHYRAHISAREIEKVWDNEYAFNAVMRQFGPRPTKGFKRSDQVALAERLVA